jgi:myo-inositol-1(or 4)-monophosphatase
MNGGPEQAVSGDPQRAVTRGCECDMNDPDRFLEVAVGAAREAGRIQRARFGKGTRVEYKGETNPVTEVDKLSEKVIVRILLESFPDHDVLTEETPFAGKGSPFKWIVDPLDGTTNYIREYPSFAVSIGLEVEGSIRVGVAYQPLLDELFCAVKGKGATLNGKRIHVSKVDLLDRSFLCTGFPYIIRENPDLYLSYFREFISRSFALRRPGSAVIDLCYLAAGRFDGFWEMKLQAWDVAAGSLIVTEAGGTVTDFQGHPFTIYSDEILASNGVLHGEMLQVMKEIDAKRIAQSA